MNIAPNDYLVAPDLHDILSAMCAIAADTKMSKEDYEWFETLIAQSIYSIKTYGEEGYKPMTRLEVLREYNKR